jgi:dTDP-4-amino-4,6-dideoxy-D-galactose acyltransferase
MNTSERDRHAPQTSAISAEKSALRKGLFFGSPARDTLRARIAAGTAEFLQTTLADACRLEPGDAAHVAADARRKRLDVLVFDPTLPAPAASALKQAGVVLILVGADATLEALADICLDPAKPAQPPRLFGPRYLLRSLVSPAEHGELEALFGVSGRTARDEVEMNRAEAELPEIVNLFKLLDWDTKFFGFPVGHLSCRRLTPAIDARARDFASTHGIALLELLCDSRDRLSVSTAERSGYSLADIRLTLERPLRSTPTSDLPAGYRIEKANETHIPALRSIARDLYQDSRYFFDERFERSKAREFFEVWVEKAVRGTFDHECLILVRGSGEPAAYCTVRRHGQSAAAIGLFGVAASAQGQHLAVPFLQNVLAALAAGGIDRVEVVTQARNVRAQRVYQRCGFVTKSTELWYHKWCR